MRTHTRRSVPLTGDADGIATAQTLAQAGALTLDGDSVISQASSPYNGMALLDPPRRITITSAGDDSGITFTIRGRDRADRLIEEVIQGVREDAAVSAYVYKAVESVEASAASDDDVEVGWGTEYLSSWLILGNLQGHGTYKVRADIETDSSVQFAVEATMQNILRDRVVGDAAERVFDLISSGNQSASVDLAAPVAAVRLKVDSADAPIVLSVIPSRTT